VSGVDFDLAALVTMSPAQLRAEWHVQFRSVAPAIGPDLLRRAIAWKRQSRVHGALPSSTRRTIDAGLAQLEKNGRLEIASLRLKSGTRLIRRWHGKIHHVLVLDDGFEHEGRRYQSLSQIARAITGAQWSGPRFFGLRKGTGGITSG
jgi:hypothetical protein